MKKIFITIDNDIFSSTYLTIQIFHFSSDLKNKCAVVNRLLIQVLHKCFMKNVHSMNQPYMTINFNTAPCNEY